MKERPIPFSTLRRCVQRLDRCDGFMPCLDERRLLSVCSGLYVLDWQPIIDLERPRPTRSVLPDLDFDLVPVVLEARVGHVLPRLFNVQLCDVELIEFGKLRVRILVRLD